jgi:SIR2-like domain
VNETEWDLVGGALKAGHYNLLIGAGASMDSPSGVIGQKCPSAGMLQSLLQDALPKVRKGSSLNRLCRTMTPEQKDELITKRFSNCRPGPTVQAIAEFRWKRIFTLNVDDALESSYDSQELPVQNYTVFNFNDAYESIRDLRTTPIIHLHGWAQRPRDGYIFDIKEYMNSISSQNLWAKVLASLIRTEPFVIMGSSLEEPDITYFMADRFDVTARSDRPPSVLVELNPDAGTEADCDEYKMTLYKGDSLSFLRELNHRFPTRPSVDDAIRDNLGDVADLAIEPKTLAEFHSDFERVPIDGLAGQDGGTNFAYGHQPSWLDIQNSRDIAREESATLLASISKLSGGPIPIICGGAGAGKTTVLKRVAWNLAQSNSTCLWVRAVGRIRVASALEVLRSLTGDTLIFVDNLADHIGEIIAIQQGLKTRKVSIVGAERSYRISHIKKIAGDSKVSLRSVGPIGALDQPLLQAYRNYGLSSLPKKDLNAFPLQKELIAIACCRILNNFEPLSSIVDKSLKDAPRDVECYVFAALASHCFRTGIDYDIISAEFPQYQVDLQADDDGALPLKLTGISDNEYVTPLNEAFSDTILGRFASQQPDRMLAIFQRLAHAIRPRVSVRAIIDGEPCARIASRLFDFDEVVKALLGLEGAGRFYDQAKRDWEWNSRYWHQIAQYRLEIASNAEDQAVRKSQAELAVQHARFAKTIERRHQFTMTTIGRVIFGKSRLLGSISPVELKESIDSLSEAIAIEREKQRVSIHPYMIMFKGLSDAIEHGAVLSPSQRSVIQSHLDRAAIEFGQDLDLSAETQRLKRII